MGSLKNTTKKNGSKERKKEREKERERTRLTLAKTPLPNCPQHVFDKRPFENIPQTLQPELWSCKKERENAGRHLEASQATQTHFLWRPDANPLRSFRHYVSETEIAGEK